MSRLYSREKEKENAVRKPCDKHFREENNDFRFEDLPTAGVLPEILRERRATGWQASGGIPTDVSSDDGF